MALSIGGIGSYGISNIRPMNYAVENKTDFSVAFAEALSRTSAASIKAASPVGYANAQKVDSTAQAVKAQEANRAYNSIAQNFSGISTGYSAASMATGYEMIGSSFDSIA